MAFSDMTDHILMRQQEMYGNRWTLACPPFKKTVIAMNGMVVLPNGEICIHGEKLDNAPLPDDTQARLEILAGIAHWFSPCSRFRTARMSLQCIKFRRAKLSMLKWMKITPPHEVYFKFAKFLQNGRMQGVQDVIVM